MHPSRLIRRLLNSLKQIPVTLRSANLRAAWLTVVFVALFGGGGLYRLLSVRADSTPQTLPFSQNWSNAGLITADDNWAGVPGIVGFRGDDLTTVTGTNPQTILADGSGTPVDVIANQANPNTQATGGVAEFDGIANPTIALQGSGTADAPHIVLNLNTTGLSGINLSYNLRDIDGSADNAVQPVALQFRVGASGNYTDIPAGFVADATTGPSLATLVTNVCVTLPAAANNQPLVQLRIMTTNAVGNDEWVGIDDIVVSTAACGAPVLSINDVTMAEGNGGPTTFSFTVTLTGISGSATFDIATLDGTAQDGNPGTEDSDYVANMITGQTVMVGSPYTFNVTVNGDTTTETNETFFVNLTNIMGATPGDTQGLGTINNDDVTLTPIHTIQGNGSTSPLVSTTVTTSGIVTGTKSNGFFIQEPDATTDADPNTSEGIFVFTSSAPPAAATIGNNVQVTGTVQEFIPSQDPNSPPMTELITPSVVQLSTGNPLPAPIVITAIETTQASETSNPLDSLEEYEGMRVTVASLVVTGATQGTITEPAATVSSSGVFIGVVTSVARPFREPGIAISDPLPAGAPGTIPRFDENPERIRVDSDAQPGTTALDVAAGTVITNLTGPLDYAFRCYTIDPDLATPPSVGVQPGSTPVPVATANEVTVASFNMERFFDTVNDPGIGEPVLTAAAFNRRLAKASLIIRTVQRYPDVIGVEEMENLSTLQAVAAQINSDAVAIDALPNPNYTAYLSEGNDVGGIDVGFLVKQSRISVVDVTQFGLANTFTNPDSSTSILNDRPPLVLRATCPIPMAGTLPFTVIVNHLRSLNGVDDPGPGSNGFATEGERVRFKRRAQAEYLANLIQTRQTANPNEVIITLGDMNAFNVNDGYVDSIGTIKGTPAPASQVTLASSDLVNPDLTNLIDTLPAAQQYSYNFDGNAQTLDHIIVNPPALALLSRFAYARDDSDFAVKNYESTNELRISDHDQPVAYFTLPAAPDLAITKTDGVTTAVPGGSVVYTITASNSSATPATGATVADTFPAVLTCTWTCAGAGGGTCTAAGSGNINDTVNLPAGGSVTYTATCAIAASATGTLSNTATVTIAGDPNAANDSATDTDTLTPQADLAITKTDGVTTATPGGSVTYTITASNAGPSNAPGSTVADTFPAALTCTWTCVGAGGGTCTAAGSGNINDTVNLPAGGSVTYTASCTISPSATGSLVNTAMVGAPGGVTDPVPGNNSATDTDTLSSQADLAITKTDGVSSVVAGSTVTYTINVTNAGPSNVTGATVADTFPAELTGVTWTCVGSGGGTCTAAGSGNINDMVNLPVGKSVLYTATGMLSISATGTLSNTATVTAPGGVTDPTPGNNSSTDTDTIVAPQADLAISKTDGVATAVPGQTVTYLINVTNAGPNPATGATVADTFPATLTGVTWTCMGSGGGTCTAAGSGNINDTVNLPVGKSVLYTATGTIAATATGTLSNTATVTAPSGVTDPNPSNNSATDTDTLTPQANLGITKTDGVTTVTAGGSTTYTITASNPGPSNAPGSTVADTFPASLTCTWTCVGAGGGTCTASGSGNINDTVNLPSGGSVTYTASCSVSGAATGTLSNTATVAAPGGVTDPVPGNNSATDTDTIISLPDLSITKTDGSATATAGSTVTYTIVAANAAGALPVTGATVTDNFPAGLANVTWTCVGAGGGTCPAGGSGNLNATVNLPAGASVTFTAIGTVVGNVPGTLSNTATVATPVGLTDSNPANNSATDTDTIVCPTVTLAPTTLPNATINTAYPTTITASPAGGNYTFSVTSGLLPTGLTLNSNGSFSGAPTQSGTFNFRITATGFGSCSGFRDYTLVVICPTITVNPASLPGGSVGTGYNQSVSASPAGTYSYAVSSGALPPGLSLNAATGALTGTPTTTGSFTFTITAAAGGCSGAGSYTIAIACPAITITTTSPLSAGQAGVAYAQTISVSPAGSYTFSLIAGSLPSGLTLNPTTGVLSGTPGVTGTYNFTVKAQAASGCNATQAYALQITCPTVTVNPASLPNGTQGTAYSQALSASPAGGSYSFTVTSGSLPTGLNLNPSTGVLSGTPTANGTFNFRITASGFGGCTGFRDYTVVIGGGACPTITLPASLPNGTVGQLYSNSVAASPSGSYTYTATGSLPPGLTLFGAFGLIFGYPTAAGSYTFTITATAGACTGNQTYTVLIGAGFLAKAGDFDGDGKADTAVWRASQANWLIVQSGNDSLQTQAWGAAGDSQAAGDYDGDGKVDLAVFAADGHWRIKRSSDGALVDKHWGLATDVPVPGDYDGDGKTDIAVWRGSEGNWYIANSSNGAVQVVAWGAAYAPYNDVAVPGDYDGDHKTDLAVFRKQDGTWYIKRSSDGTIQTQAWGLGTDVPVPGDYDGDGKTDIAVWRGQSSTWFIIRSGSGLLQMATWGASYAPYNDVPVPGDYDGDGKTDIAVWRPAIGTWYSLNSSDGQARIRQHGQAGDTPVTARQP